MRIIELQQAIKSDIFSNQTLTNILAVHYNNVNAKVRRLVQDGDLIRLKRGLFSFSKAYRKQELNPIIVANLLYGPSYVSFEYALAHYNMIPERVIEITSGCAGRTKKYFKNDIGNFSYKPVPGRVYPIGIDWLFNNEQGGSLIATPEKALCDKIWSDKQTSIKSQRDIITYLEQDLRIDTGDWINLNSQLIKEIAAAYRSSRLDSLARAIAKRRH